MKVWLVTVGEPLPTDEGVSRLLRAGILAGMLSERGHNVVWWTSTFDHSRKRHRFSSDTVLTLEHALEIRLVHGCSYRSNLSLARIRNHTQVARRFAELSERELVPDVVLCSLPTLELAVEATRYGKRHHVPVVIDVRDLWPDLLVDRLPVWARGLANVAVSPMRRQAREACRRATAITGNAPDFVDWGLALAGRPRSIRDRHFWHGYAEVTPTAERLETAKTFWSQHGVAGSEGVFTACFFGAIGHQSELSTVIRAARVLEGSGRRFRFVLCGDGDRLQALREEASDCPSVLFPGWIGAPEIWTLMSMSKVGLAMYRSNVGYVGNLPNKPIEYLSAGLPVVSSLRGFLEEVLANNDCGVTFPNGDAGRLAELLITLHDDRPRLAQMGQNARRVFAREFDARVVYRAMIDYLIEIAEAYTLNVGGTRVA